MIHDKYSRKQSPHTQKILTLIHNVEKETNRPATRIRNNRKKNYIKKENKKEVDEITSAKTQHSISILYRKIPKNDKFDCRLISINLTTQKALFNVIRIET
jgi:hypothetical protein